MQLYFGNRLNRNLSLCRNIERDNFNWNSNRKAKKSGWALKRVDWNSRRQRTLEKNDFRWSNCEQRWWSMIEWLKWQSHRRLIQYLNKFILTSQLTVLTGEPISEFAYFFHLIYFWSFQVWFTAQSTLKSANLAKRQKRFRKREREPNTKQEDKKLTFAWLFRKRERLSSSNVGPTNPARINKKKEKAGNKPTPRDNFSVKS